MELGKEYLQPNEERDTAFIIEAIERQLEKQYGKGKMLRQFHAKMHGCLQAKFIVHDDLPEKFRYGFLQQGKSYDAWIRFSNGNSKVLDDRKGDLRGMAIKLLNVEGEFLVQDETIPQSQDILLVSYPTLMSPDIASFKRNIKALSGGFIGMLLFGINPINWPALIRTLQSMRKTDNLFTTQFWSVSPSRLGREEQAVKYSAIPAAGANTFQPEKNNPGFLRKTMQAILSVQDVKFDFNIQLQEDANTMPIENPCINWTSPFHSVATIIIPKQIFDTPEQDAFGEGLAFSPWHSLKEHQPLGGISRARKQVYWAISKFRLQHNKNL